VASAQVFLTDTPAAARAKLDQFFRSSYEAARKNSRASSLSYDEALAVAPATMDKLNRHYYETGRKTYMATRKPNEAPSLTYDEALALARSVWKCGSRKEKEYYIHVFPHGYR